MLADPASVEAFDAGRRRGGWLAASPSSSVGVGLRRPAAAARARSWASRWRAGWARAWPPTGERAPALAAARPGRGRAAGRPRGQAAAGLGAVAAGSDRASAALSARGGTLPRVAFDTQIAAYILNAALRSQSLADICAERLAIELPKAGELRGPEHAAVQAVAVAAAREPAGRDLAAEPGLRRILDELELPLDPGARRHGGHRAWPSIARRWASLAGLRDGDRPARRRTSTPPSATSSPGQPQAAGAGALLRAGPAARTRTKTGYSTDASVLEDLRPAHPMVPHAARLAALHQAALTYVDALPLLLDPATGRLHTTFQQAVASTGRLSLDRPEPPEHPHPHRARSQDPPRIRGRRPGPRAAGRRLQPDRAARAGPRVGRRAPARGLRAARGHPPRDRRAGAPQGPGRRHRRRALDGQDGQLRAGLRHERLRAGQPRANIPRGEAQDFISSLLRGLQRHQLLHAAHPRDRASSGATSRRCSGAAAGSPSCEARNSALRGAGERMAINMPIQGTAADIMKIAMIRLHERLRASSVARRGCCSRSTTRWCWRCRAPTVDGAGADRARDDGDRHSRWTCRSTWTSRSATTGSR